MELKNFINKWLPTLHSVLQEPEKTQMMDDLHKLMANTKDSQLGAVVMQLHKDAELIEKEAALHYSNKELHNMHTKMDLARSLRTVANYLDGVQSA